MSHAAERVAIANCGLQVRFDVRPVTLMTHFHRRPAWGARETALRREDPDDPR